MINTLTKTLRLFFVGLAIGAMVSSGWYYQRLNELSSAAQQICRSIEVYNQIGAYRNAIELAKAGLSASFPDFYTTYRFDNLSDPPNKPVQNVALQTSCRVTGMPKTTFEIAFITKSNFKDQMYIRVFSYSIIAMLLIWLINAFLSVALERLISELNFSFAKKLGLTPGRRSNWIDSLALLEKVPAINESSQKIIGLSTALDQQMARATELEVALEKRRLFSKYAHDIRSPIGAIQILIKKHESEFSEDELNLAKHALNRLLDIPEMSLRDERSARNLIQTARMGISDLQLVLGLIHKRFTNQDVCELMMDLAKLSSVGDISRNKYLKIGPMDLDRLVSNLIENARNVGAKLVTISASITEENLSLAIADNGPGGLPKDLNVPHRPKSKGNGLGLEIVREIIQKSEAALIVDSKLNNGSTIHISWKLY